MNEAIIKCTVEGNLKGGKAVCGHVTAIGKNCSLNFGECNLQAGVKEGIANGVLQGADSPKEK